jgi:preprotein translocase subunit SecE
LGDDSVNDRTKTGTSTTASRQGIGNVQEFVRSVIAEMRRVTWPTREEWVSATVLAIVLVVGIGLFTYVVDFLFGKLFLLVHS